MVLLHGITNTWRIWLPVLPALEREHDVNAPTLAGHYEAPLLPAGAPPSVSALTDAVERTLDESGFDVAHLVGNSLGDGSRSSWRNEGARRQSSQCPPPGRQPAPKNRVGSRGRSNSARGSHACSLPPPVR